jgi:hypothetical protein
MRQQYYFVYFHLPSRATFIYAIVPAALQIKKNGSCQSGLPLTENTVNPDIRAIPRLSP